MAASIALNSSVNIDATPDAGSKGLGGLFNRVKAVGEKLRNTKREDMAWMAGNIVIGAAASKLAVAAASVGLSATISAGISTAMTVGVAALGLTASATAITAAASVGSIIAVGAASAVVGGLASGTVRALSAHIRERLNTAHETPRSFTEALKQESLALLQIKDFKQQVLKSTKTALLGAGLMGAFSGASAFLEHTQIGRDIAGTAKDAFQRVAQNQASFWKGFGKTLHAKLPMSGAHAMTADDMPRAMKTIPAAAPIVAPAADVAQDNVPRAMGKPAVVAPTPVAAPDNDMPRAMGKVPAAAPVADIVPPAVAAPIEPAVQEAAQPKTELPTKSSVGQHTTLDGGVRERALAWARTMNPLAKAAVPDVPTSAPLPTPVADIAPKPMVSAPVAPLADVQPRATTVHERAMEWVKKMNPNAKFASDIPVSADKVVDVAKLAETDLTNVDPKHVVVRATTGVEIRMPARPDIDAEFKTVKAATLAAGGAEAEVELDPKKMAAACVADLPNSNADFVKQGGVLPNTCTIVAGKETMAAGDYVTVRDAADANAGAQRGLRVLFASLAERTHDFIGRTVTAGTLPSMSAEKLAMDAPAP